MSPWRVISDKFLTSDFGKWYENICSNNSDLTFSLFVNLSFKVISFYKFSKKHVTLSNISELRKLFWASRHLIWSSRCSTLPPNGFPGFPAWLKQFKTWSSIWLSSNRGFAWGIPLLIFTFLMIKVCKDPSFKIPSWVECLVKTRLKTSNWPYD